MAKFRVTAPDGQTYDVEGPEGATEQDALAQVQAQHQPSQSAPTRPIIAATAEDALAQARSSTQPQPQIGQPSVMDYVRTNPVIGATTQGALRIGQGTEQLLAHGVGMIPGLGAIPKAVDESIARSDQGYEAAKRRVVNASSDPRLQEALINTGEIAPSFVNPAGLAGNAIPAIRAASPVVNAAIRSGVSGAAFGASQPVTGDTSNYGAKKLGQVLTGAAAGAGTGALAERLGQPARVVPMTTKELKTASGAAYKEARAKGVGVQASSVSKAIDDAEAEARTDLTYRPALQPKSATALKQIRDEIDAAQKSGGTLSFDDIYAFRRMAATTLDSPEKSERAVGHRIVDKIDEYMDTVAQKDPNAIVSGNAKDANEAAGLFTKGRDLYSRSAKSDTIDRMVQKAINRGGEPGGLGGSNYTTAGFSTALRQQFRALADNERAMRRFTPTEQDAIRKVSRGGPIENTLRVFGKFAPTNIIGGGSGAYLGYQLGGEAGAVAVPALGYAARTGDALLTSRNARIAHELVRAGKQPLPIPVPGPAPNVPVGSAMSSPLLQLYLQQRAEQ